MGSTWNLPDGVSTDQIDAHYQEPVYCSDCANLTDGCCDYGICFLKFEEAFDKRFDEDPMAPWEAAKWAMEWVTDNYVDEQEPACERFKPWQSRC